LNDEWPVDAALVDRLEAPRAREPVQGLERGGDRSGVPGLDAEGDERLQPPERPAPLAVGMDAVVPGERIDQRVTRAL
jgi:hypothetical protein